MDEMKDDTPNLDEMFSPVEVIAPTEEPAVTEKPAVAEKKKLSKKKLKPSKQPKQSKEIFKRIFDDARKISERTMLYIMVGIAVGVPAILIVLSFLNFLSLSTVAYLTGLVLVAIMALASHKTNTIYIIFLGGVIVALMTAVYLLWIKFEQYNGDVKAQEAKQRISVTQPFDRDILV